MHRVGVPLSILTYKEMVQVKTKVGNHPDFLGIHASPFIPLAGLGSHSFLQMHCSDSMPVVLTLGPPGPC